jgi:hypothetical protein
MKLVCVWILSFFFAGADITEQGFRIQLLQSSADLLRCLDYTLLRTPEEDAREFNLNLRLPALSPGPAL